jgi:hypothetical protein
MQRDQDPFNTKIQRATSKTPRKPKKGAQIGVDDEEKEEFMNEKIQLEPLEKASLGLTQTNIPESMRRFNIMEISEGSVFG